MGIRRCSHGHLYVDLVSSSCPECGELSTAPGNRLLRETLPSSAEDDCQTGNPFEYPRDCEREARVLYAGPPILDQKNK